MNAELEIINKILDGESLKGYELEACAFGEIGCCVEVIHDLCQEKTTIFKIGSQYYAIDWHDGFHRINCWKQPYKVERKEEVVTTTVVSYVPMEE